MRDLALLSVVYYHVLYTCNPVTASPGIVCGKVVAVANVSDVVAILSWERNIAEV